MTTLIEIATQYKADADRLMDTELPDDVIVDTLSGMAGDLEEKAVNVAAVVLSLDGFADQIKAREEALAKRRKAFENRAKNLRSYLLLCLQRAELKRVERPELRLRRQNNPASLVVEDAAKVPARFWRIPEPPPAEIDKVAVKAALKDKVEVPGVHLEQNERLVIE